MLTFLDFGCLALIVKEIPNNEETFDSRIQLLFRVRKFTYYIYGAAFLMTSTLIILSLLFGERDYTIALLATLIIYPVQGSYTYRSTLLVALKKQRKSLNLAILVTVCNLTVTLLTIRSIGIYSIIVGPMFGYVIGYFATKDSQANLKFSSVLFFAPIRARDLVSKANVMGATNILSYALLNIDFFMCSIIFKGEQLGYLAFALNIMSLAFVVPIFLSSYISPIISSSATSSNESTRDQLSRTLESVKNQMVLIVLAANFCQATLFTIIIPIIFPEYLESINLVWILALSTFFYSVTFYSSNLLFVLNLQHKIVRILIRCFSLSFLVLILIIFNIYVNIQTIILLGTLRNIGYFVAHYILLKKFLTNSARLRNIYFCRISAAVILLLSGLFLSNFGHLYVYEIILISVSLVLAISAFSVLRSLQKVLSNSDLSHFKDTPFEL